MSARKPFTFLAAIVFLVVGLAHGYRLATGAEIMIGGKAVPMWVSWLGLAVPLLLSWMLVREARR